MSTLAVNKRARHDYSLLEEFEAGIVLSGPEVKSAKLGQVNFAGSYVSVREQGAAIVNFHISPYKPARSVQTGYDPVRERKLLLHRDELASWLGKSRLPGLTLIPVSLYTKGSLVKLGVALAKGKRKYDKRETIKKREVDRRLRRVVRA